MLHVCFSDRALLYKNLRQVMLQLLSPLSIRIT